jgi:hypothetical protein
MKFPNIHKYSNQGKIIFLFQFIIQQHLGSSGQGKQ